jgi:chemosensory pili system protein ChpA (sensor histidine kinase/response regulator)
LSPDIYAKRQFARIQQQLRKTLSQEQDDSPVTERMLREILFLLARAEDGSASADEVRRLYRLNGTVPAQFEAPRYGRFDARRLREALDATAQAKATWEKGVRDGLSALPAFAAAARQMDLAMAQLPLPGMQRLSAAMANLRRAFDAGQGAVTERVSLEVATGLLFVEQTLVLGPALASQNDQKAGELADRIEALQSLSGEQSPMPDWLAALLRSTQDRLTLDAFVRELQVNLHECERALDAFFRDPQERGGLGAVDHQLVQVSGALRLLGYQDASQGVDTVARRIGVLIASSQPPAKSDCEQVAQSLGALGFFVESLRRTDRSKVGFEFHADDSGFVARLQAPIVELDPGETETPSEWVQAATLPVTQVVDESIEAIDEIERAEVEETLSLPAAFDVLDEVVELSEALPQALLLPASVGVSPAHPMSRKTREGRRRPAGRPAGRPAAFGSASGSRGHWGPAALRIGAC